MSNDGASARLVVSTALASQRAASEDRVLVERTPAGLLVVVADGAGGMRGGARAADLLVDHARGSSLAAMTEGGLPGALIAMLRAADQTIAADPIAGETTALAVVVTDDRILGASAGDSEAWLMIGDGRDVLTASQRRKRIGSGCAEPVSFTSSFTAGTLIVGTDGLFAYAKADAICEIARSSAAEALAACVIDLVRLPGGRLADDVAVVAVRRLADLPNGLASARMGS
jgi:serine/threonine protein phosphatase PrpC